MTKKLYKHIGIFVDKVCIGMKFVSVSEKSTKKEDFSVLEKFITHLIQSHSYGYFIFYVSKQYL